MLFENSAGQAYAERVVVAAEAALDILIPLFGFEPPPITLRLEDTSDLYNAFAPPLPRSSVSLRQLFPIEGAFSYRAEDDLQQLLLHELTHVMQFPILSGAAMGSSSGWSVKTPPVCRQLGCWRGSLSGSSPNFATGGRRDDPLTRGILESAAFAKNWPSLSDASLSSYANLSTYGRWPGGMAQYLFGVGFVSHLIQKHGFEAIKKSLAQHNASGFLRPFKASWQIAIGTDLQTEWRTWQDGVTAAAETRAQAAKEVQLRGEVKTDSGWYTRAPALSPDGSQLAWMGWPTVIMLADVHGNELRNARTLLDGRLPAKLKWIDAHTLLYARPVFSTCAYLLRAFHTRHAQRARNAADLRC